LVSSLLITGFLLSIWLNLPSISNGYKLTGQKLQYQEKLAAVYTSIRDEKEAPGC
jgi:hypothetical protein